MREGMFPTKILLATEGSEEATLVAQTAIDAIRADSFWARPAVDDERHRETVEWEASIYRARAEALIAREPPDAYLWGPRSDLLGT